MLLRPGLGLLVAFIGDAEGQVISPFGRAISWPKTRPESLITTGSGQSAPVGGLGCKSGSWNRKSLANENELLSRSNFRTLLSGSRISSSL